MSRSVVSSPSRRRTLAAAVATLALGLPLAASAAGVTLLNVSYDVAREFYKEINPAFQKAWKAQAGEDVTINQSFLWSDEAQAIAAKHQLRPRSPALLEKYAKDFPKVTTFTIDEVFGGWTAAQKEHFDDGAVYDQILAAGRKQ